MKRSSFFTLITISLALTFSLGLTGCKKKPYGVTPIHGSQTGGKNRGGSGMEQESPGLRLPGDTGITESEPAPLLGMSRFDGRSRDFEALKAERVQFDLDSATIKTSEKPKLDKVAAYLKANPGHDLIIEGHCDERGTEGYNLSLGEKRALALREYLIKTAGVGVERSETISYGETKPIEPLHSEAAFSKNRRGEFVVVLPAQ